VYQKALAATRGLRGIIESPPCPWRAAHRGRPTSDGCRSGSKARPTCACSRYQTNGAFSTRFMFGLLLRKLRPRSGIRSSRRAYQNGFGVGADELVLPRESDLLTARTPPSDARVMRTVTHEQSPSRGPRSFPPAQARVGRLLRPALGFSSRRVGTGCAIDSDPPLRPTVTCTDGAGAMHSAQANVERRNPFATSPDG